MNTATTFETREAAARFILKCSGETPSELNTFAVVCGGFLKAAVHVANKRTREIVRGPSLRTRLEMIGDAERRIRGKQARKKHA